MSHRISTTIEQALKAAGLDRGNSTVNTVLETIRNALKTAGIEQKFEPQPGHIHAGAAATEVLEIDPVTQQPLVEERPAIQPGERQQLPTRRGRFLSFVYSGAHGRRDYKLYVPASYSADAPMPLVVMLHGCKQNPDDFARGTRLNDVAEQQGFLVAYPAQSKHANGSNCWNWFEAQHQSRDGAEPSIIVGIVRQIANTHQVDERRVFVAGLSAGAAMAVILGEAYPDVFAAVAAHSGLPHGAANDVASAFAAMHGAVGPAASPLGAPTQAPRASTAVPTIVFHGDRDGTVVPKNGAAIAEQAVSRLTSEHGALVREVEQRHANGRSCTRITYVDRNGRAVAEHWTVHGAGHAWFGGSSAGSFSDPQGPDASREMMRFFLRAS